MLRLRKPEGARGWLLLALCLVALHQGLLVAAIKAKASLAPVLIEKAWSRSLATGSYGHKPWPWADTWPVARLHVPAHGIDLPVLAGDSGHALAFAPGHSLASSALGEQGRAVVGGHRDTHFAFLRELAPGDRLRLQLADGGWRHYRAGVARVVDSREEPLVAGTGRESLLLVTCFPFGVVLTGGPMRYVVEAWPEPSVFFTSPANSRAKPLI